eukprot:gnl/TRDRNA2_/TRDRNA2_42008_c0_seq1.p1 gnl/TRDRNA2_/TRDRNA2_42008_c0~~gnl/TRDRNA2_/TRDRNA2_42008_c0_seq1.p1  ORF type:complete len:512 (-),score=111.42 gnl/TRDRNA2_/TRDRNA2_42008_c0_seq1:218-1753(-)
MGAFSKGAPPVSVDDLFGYSKLQDLLVTIVDGLREQDENIAQTNKELSKLRIDNEETSAKLEQLQASLPELLDRSVDKSVQANPMVQLIADLKNQMKASEKAMGKVKSRLDAIDASDSAKTWATEKALEDSVTSLRQEMQKSLEALPQSWAHDIKATAAALNEKSAKVDDRIAAVEAALNVAVKKASSEASKKFESRIDSMQQMEGDLNRRISVVEEQMSDISTQLVESSNATSQIDSKELFEQLEATDSPFIAMRSSIHDLSHSVAQISTTVTDISERVQVHDEQVTTLNESLTAPAAAGKEELAELEAKLSMCDSRLTRSLEDAVHRVVQLERVATKSCDQECRNGLNELKIDVKTELWPEVRSLRDNAAMESSRLLREIAELRAKLLEVLGKAASATSRCLSCQTMANTAVDKMMGLGTDGKMYRRRPTTLEGEQAATESTQQRSPSSPPSQGGAGAVMRRYHEIAGRPPPRGSLAFPGCPSAPELMISLHRPQSRAAAAEAQPDDVR